MLRRLLVILLLCDLMVLSGACRSPVPMRVNAEYDSLISCLPLVWPHSPSKSTLGTGCDVVIAAPLRELLEDDELIVNASDEIIRRFELSADELIVETYVGAVGFTWWYRGNRYTLYLQEGKKPWGNVFFDSSAPPLKQIVACLNEPESYRFGYMLHERFIFTLGLYFPEYGVVAYSTQVARQENIVFNEDLTTTRLILVPSGTLEEVFSSASYDSSDSGPAALEPLKLWPGSLEAMIETVQADYCLDYPEFCPTDEP